MKALKSLTLISAIATLALSGLAQAKGPGGSNAISVAMSPQICAVTPSVSMPLSESAVATLRFMREEEKMARDVYRFLGNTWGSRVFGNIAASEQTHMDQVLSFMQTYGIADSATEQAGVFNDVSLQALYNQLVARGSTSIQESMNVGALIEEVDIRDLRAAIGSNEDAALDQLYLNLTSGSYNHLNAFVGQIEMMGNSYTPQILTVSEVANILAGIGIAGVSVAAAGLNSGNVAISTGTCFTPSIRSATYSYGNGATISGNAVLTLATLVQAEDSALGVQADLFAVVEHTPVSGTSPLLLMRSGNDWVSWDGNLNSLSSALQLTLTRQQEFQIFQGSLAALPGQFSISTGYRLPNGTLVFAREPISFRIQ